MTVIVDRPACDKRSVALQDVLVECRVWRGRCDRRQICSHLRGTTSENAAERLHYATVYEVYHGAKTLGLLERPDEDAEGSIEYQSYPL